MKTKRTHIVIPVDLAGEIDSLVGRRGRSRFLTLAAKRELKRLRLLQALERAAESWKDKDHPELRKGSAGWVEKQRKENERRLRRLAARRRR